MKKKTKTMLIAGAALVVAGVGVGVGVGIGMGGQTPPPEGPQGSSTVEVITENIAMTNGEDQTTVVGGEFASGGKAVVAQSETDATVTTVELENVKGNDSVAFDISLKNQTTENYVFNLVVSGTNLDGSELSEEFFEMVNIELIDENGNALALIGYDDQVTINDIINSSVVDEKITVKVSVPAAAEETSVKLTFDVELSKAASATTQVLKISQKNADQLPIALAQPNVIIEIDEGTYIVPANTNLETSLKLQAVFGKTVNIGGDFKVRGNVEFIGVNLTSNIEVDKDASFSLIGVSATSRAAISGKVIINTGANVVLENVNQIGNIDFIEYVQEQGNGGAQENAVKLANVDLATISASTLHLKNTFIEGVTEKLTYADGVSIQEDNKAYASAVMISENVKAVIKVDGIVSIESVKGQAGIGVAPSSSVEIYGDGKSAGDVLSVVSNERFEDFNTKTIGCGASAIGAIGRNDGDGVFYRYSDGVLPYFVGKIYIHDIGSLSAEAYGWNAQGIGGTVNAGTANAIQIENTNILKAKGGFVGESGIITSSNYWGKKDAVGGCGIGVQIHSDLTVHQNIELKNVNINEVLGGAKAAGIGGACHTGVTIRVDGCTILKVEGGTSSAGIGGGRAEKGDAASWDTVKQPAPTNIYVVDSQISNVTGGNFGAGIGSGYDTYCKEATPVREKTSAFYSQASQVNIKIVGNTTLTNIQGGNRAAGIGSGFHSTNLAIEIDEGIDTSTVKKGSEDSIYVLAAKGTNGFHNSEYEYRPDITTAEDIGYGMRSFIKEAKHYDNWYDANGDGERNRGDLGWEYKYVFITAYWTAEATEATQTKIEYWKYVEKLEELKTLAHSGNASITVQWQDNDQSKHMVAQTGSIDDFINGRGSEIAPAQVVEDSLTWMDFVEIDKFWTWQWGIL